MTLLRDEDREQVRKQLEELPSPVRVIMFTQTLECEFCAETRDLVEEVASLSDMVEALIYNFVTDSDKADEYRVDKVPAIAIVGAEDYGVRFYGIPAGYEFASLIEAVKIVSSGESGLSEATKEALAQIEEPVHFQVFVTPTCPYCPRTVVLTHKMAVENKNIRADGVEITEFPHLAINYQVRGVPRTVINQTQFVDGMVPEAVMLEMLLMTLRGGKPADPSGAD
jgi:glutaredoxin-like protein